MNSLWLDSVNFNNNNLNVSDVECDVCIVGAGIFGMTCAYYLTKLGLDVVVLEKDTTVEEINAALKKAAEGELKGIMGYNELPLVSRDYNGCPLSSIVDGLSTMMVGKRMAKVVSWYDNEWGYSNRVVDLAAYIAKQGL